MRPTERGQVFVLLCPAGEAVDDHCQFGENELQPTAEEDQIGVAGCIDLSKMASVQKARSHSVTKQEVAPRCMIGAAAGATIPKT